MQFFGSLVSFCLIVYGIKILRPQDELARNVVLILGSAILFRASDAFTYWFEAKVQSKYTVWVTNATFIFFSVLKVILISLNAPLIVFAWVMFSEIAVVALALAVVLNVHGLPIKSLRFKIDHAISLLRDSWSLIITNAAIIIYLKIDQIMIGQMVGDKSVGIYTAALRVSEFWYFVPMAIVTSVFPAIITAKTSCQKLYLNRLQTLYNLLTVICILVAFAFTIISDWLIVKLYGQEFSKASEVLSIHIWSGVFVAMGVARGKWLLVENLQSMGYWYILIAMVVNILGNYIIIPHYGTTGAASVTIISQFVATIVAPALFKKTRISSIMLIRSLYPSEWIQLSKYLIKSKSFTNL